MNWESIALIAAAVFVFIAWLGTLHDPDAVRPLDRDQMKASAKRAAESYRPSGRTREE